ncbi:MAG: ABC transporter ATP-binding protein [Oscillospiraceae bacterium]
MKEKVKNIMCIIKIPFKFSPINSSILCFFEILFGFIPSIQALATAKFIDTVILFVNEKLSFTIIIPSLILVVVCIGLIWCSHNIIELFIVKLEIKLREKFKPIIISKKSSLKYHYIENDKTWDLLTRMSDEPEKKCVKAFDMFIFLIRIIINLITLLAILAAKSYLSALIIVLISFPLFKISYAQGNKVYDSEKEATKYERRHKYLGEVLTSRENADERALFGFTDVCNERWKVQYAKGMKIINKAQFKLYNSLLIAGISTTLISIIIFIVLVNLVRTDSIQVGLCVSLTISLNSLINMMSWGFTEASSELSKSSEYMGEMRKFFGLDEQEDALEKPASVNFSLNSLEFKNVNFKYPETDKYVLKNLSFIIESGKHYALVGVNGSGKTTISKLITGLYDNYEGEILLNGKEIREYSQCYLKAICTIVYQDFAKYSISLKDNVLLGNVNLENDEEKNNAFNHALDLMELNDVVDNLKDKENTYLGKIKKDGVDLSGGQWQRIAIARSITNNSPLRILDEPTAALDPISESKIYEDFEKISQGNTTIFISHRLGSTKLADTIYVIDNGCVAESGSHQHLLEKNGIYADMYNSQKSWYI